MRIPAKIKRKFEKVESLVSNKEVLIALHEIVANGMNKSMLTNSVAKHLMLNNSELNKAHDGSFDFTKCIQMVVNRNINFCNFEFEKIQTTSYNSDGDLVSGVSFQIIGQREPDVYEFKPFYEATEYQDSITAKGSNRIFDNNSKATLETASSINYRVRVVEQEVIDLYSSLLFEETKHKVSENQSDYLDRLIKIGEETKLFGGYIFPNYRKLDSSGRDYQLSRFGYAVEYGDPFEKYLIQPEGMYLVTDKSVLSATAYLHREYDFRSVKKQYGIYTEMIDENLSQVKRFKNGMKCNFTIGRKELGKMLHFIEVCDEIIWNEGGNTRTLIGLDFTNSGGIMSSIHFGDKTMLRTMNMIIGAKLFDTHQRVADFLCIERNDAKDVMQGPNHGAVVKHEHEEMVNEIFGENYKYLNMLAKYGVKLAQAGHTSLEFVAPDGVKSIWTPYTLNCKVSMEDGSYIDAIMPFIQGVDGAKVKGYGLGVMPNHAFDSYVKRTIIDYLIQQGIPCKSTLDNFLVPAGMEDIVIARAFKAFSNGNGWLESQLLMIELQTGVSRGWNLPNVPTELIHVSGKVFGIK